MSLLDLFKKKGSGDVAKDRLKLLLVSDRANCSPEVMEMIKNDIIKVISKYMVIDAEGLDIQITSDMNLIQTMALCLHYLQIFLLKICVTAINNNRINDDF